MSHMGESFQWYVVEYDIEVHVILYANWN